MISNNSITGYLEIDQELLAIARGNGTDTRSEEEVFLIAKNLANRIETRVNALLVDRLSEQAFENYLLLIKKKESSEQLSLFLKAEIPDFNASVQTVINNFLSKYKIK